MLDIIIATIGLNVAKLKELERTGEGDYLLRYALGTLNDNERPFLPSPWDIDLDRRYHLTDIRYAMESILQYGATRFYGFLKSTMGYIEPVHQETRHVLSLMPRVEEGFRDYGVDPQTEGGEDYRDARAMADIYLMIWHVLPKIESLIAELRTVCADLDKRTEFTYQPHKYRPDHDEIETLYHATPYASEIVRDGFSAEKPKGYKGVGSLGDQPEISFTHDIKIAHDIMRALKEIWMIVHGQLTRRQIINWMHVEGIKPKDATYYLSNRLPVDDVRQVINLYRTYLALSKLRTDPVMVSPENLVPAMQGRDITDIGIISCQVKLDKTEEYLEGEAEFRVKADRVVGPIKRVV